MQQRHYVVGLIAAALGLPLGCGAQHQTPLEPVTSEYRSRLLADYQNGKWRTPEDRPMVYPVAAQEDVFEPRDALLTEPRTDDPIPDIAALLSQIPDPVDAPQEFAARMETLRESTRESFIISKYETVIEHAMTLLEEDFTRDKFPLSLEECIRRTLENAYQIRIASYSPAVSRTQIVQAEAAFDSVFFLDFNWNNTDQPTATELAGNQSDTRSYSGGIRKLLPTGMQAQIALRHSRTFTDLQFATINPSYETDFVASFTQPLLRGFGLDYNRAPIELAREDLHISRAQFAQTVRETLLQAEQLYWSLLQARRVAAIEAIAVGQNFATYRNFKRRDEHDATPVQLNNSLARWKSRMQVYLDAVKTVRDLEDELKFLMNTATLRLSEDVELVPTTEPFLAPLILDQFAEVRTAIDNRSEIYEARSRIEQARINTMRAKNETMPQLDLSFNYEVSGLDISADSSFDNMTTNRFRSYTVGVNFSVPFGNRGPQAAWRGARLQESQSVVALRQITDRVILEVNEAIRELLLRFRQIPTQYRSVVAESDNLRALQVRTERVDPTYLETELNAVERLANARQRLVQFIVQYNNAVVELEAAKGTLLEYNNIVLSDEPAR